MNYPTIAHIDLNALLHNIFRIKKIAPQSKILAMVKSNAYGHGMVEVAAAIEKDVGAFGVIFLHEALKLHDAGIKNKIVIFSGFFDEKDLHQIDKFGFETLIHNFEQLEILEKAKLKNPLRVWLKIDTGMHRLGFQAHEAKEAYTRLMADQRVVKPLQLITHFADADNVLKEKTFEQLANFENITTGMEGVKCLANSSAILGYSKARADWIRPGITMHGVSPMSHKPAATLGLIPVMTLESHIIATHELKKGDTVGYGGGWVCPEDMRIGIVAIGYGHGYPRNMRTGTPVLVNGVRCPVIGRVAMDMTTIDLRNAPQTKVGDSVILWGKDLPIEEIALGADTIPYELFCRMTQHVFYSYS